MEGEYFYKEHFRFISCLKIKEARDALLGAIELNYGPAKCRLGYYHHNGYLGFEKSNKLALSFWIDAYKTNKNPLALMYLVEYSKEYNPSDPNIPKDTKRLIDSGHPVVLAYYSDGKNIKETYVKKAISLGMVEGYEAMDRPTFTDCLEGIKMGSIELCKTLCLLVPVCFDTLYRDVERYIRLSWDLDLLRCYDISLFKGYPEAERCREAIIVFTLCFRKEGYLLKDLIQLIAKKIWETRNDPAWTLICPLVIGPQFFVVNKYIY